MPYDPVVVERFGGLNLADDPSEVGLSAATSLLNVDFFSRGRAGTRAGSTKLNTGAFTSGTVGRVWEWSSVGALPLRYSLSGTTATIDQLNTDGTDAVFATWGSAGIYTSHAFIGDGTNEFMFVATQTPATPRTVRRIEPNGTNVASVGSCWHLAAWDNRLVQANVETAPAGAVTGADTVFFSDPGAPETFDATNFVHLGIGDGEIISAVVPWRELLFVFKQTRMYIFYAVSTDSTGGAVFQYRTVDLPAYLDADNSLSGTGIAAGPDGIYIALADGIYVTTGGVPVEVSQPVRPLFDKTADASLRRDSVALLYYAGGRLFARYTNDSASATRTLVYDPASKTWTIWGLASVVNVFEHLQGDGGHVLYWADQTNVYELDDDATTDNGTAIASHYQSGFQRLAKGLPATIRRFELTGSGTVTHTLYGDHSTAAEWQGKAATSVTMGTAPAVARAYALQSGRARDLAFKVSASSGAWSLNRWVGQISAVRSY